MEWLMAEEMVKACAELQAADVSAGVSVKSGQDDAKLSDAGEDPGDSVPLCTNKT